MTHLNIQQGLNVEVVTTLIIKKLYDAALSVPEPLEGELDAAYMSGNLLVNKAYRSLVEYLTSRFDDLSINVTVGYYTPFEDPIIGQYYINSIGDGVGVMINDIENVTNSLCGAPDLSWQNPMNADTRALVTSLNDFHYFKGITGHTAIKGFPNATSIKFPDTTMQYIGLYENYAVSNCANLQNIDYGNCIFVAGGNGAFVIINENNVIEDWDSSLLPQLNSYDRITLFKRWTKLKKILFPEGKTHFYETFNSCRALLYVEYPTTTVSLGRGSDFARDSNHRIPCMVVKAVNPPIWTGWNSTDTTSASRQGLGWTQLPVAIYVPDNSVTAYTSVTSNGTTNESVWANPAISVLIKPMSEIPLIYRDMGTVTLADIDRI